MRRTLFIAAAFVSLVFAASASGQAKYETYNNARFNYSIEYPANLLVPQDEAQNGDGRVFTARKGTAKLSVWGRYNALFDTLKKAYASDLKERGSGVTYKTLLKDGYVISGTKGGKVYYQKTILSGTDGDGGAVFATFVLEYRAVDKPVFDAVAARVSKSFKFQ